MHFAIFLFHCCVWLLSNYKNAFVSDSEEDKCWHDPIYNQTSVRSDLQVYNLTQEEVSTLLALEKHAILILNSILKI